MISVDIIRIIAMLMVIAMHTILNFTIRIDFFPSKLWWLLEPIMAVSKTGVHLFFMLSGYLVIHKPRLIQENWRHTWKRILIPLLFFAGMNLWYEYNHFGQWTPVINQFWQDQALRIASFPSSPLWFLVALLFMYLLNPLWYILFANEKQRSIAQYLAILLLIYSVIAGVVQYSLNLYVIFFNNFTAWISFVFFYVYGGLVRKGWYSVTNHRRNWLLILLGLSLTIAGDYGNMVNKVQETGVTVLEYTGSHISVSIIMLAIGLFNELITGSYRRLQPITAGITWLAGLSYGIYLLHNYIVAVFTDLIGFSFDQLQMNVYVYNLLNFFLVFIGSLILTIVVKKTPLLRAVIGES